MPDYLLYRLRPDGEAQTPPESVFATSDEAALRHAGRDPGEHGCEVWSKDRFLAFIKPLPAPAPEPARRRLHWPSLRRQAAG